MESVCFEESESESVSRLVRSTLGYLMDCSPPGSSVHGILQARILEWVAISSSRGIKPRSPALQADSLPAEPLRKPIELREFPFNHFRGRVQWH